MLITLLFFFFNDTATTEIYTLSLHDALPISRRGRRRGVPGRAEQYDHRTGPGRPAGGDRHRPRGERSEEHTSELQSRLHLVCRLLLEKKKKFLHINEESDSGPFHTPHQIDPA